MRIEEIPNYGDTEGLADLAMFRSVVCVGVLADSEHDLFNAFDWSKTREGYEFWDRVNDCDYPVYRERYPKGWDVSGELIANMPGPAMNDYVGEGGC